MAIKNLANAYFALSFYDEALNLYKKAVEDCNDDEVFYNLSACFFIQQKYEAAKMYIHSALASHASKP